MCWDNFFLFDYFLCAKEKSHPSRETSGMQNWIVTMPRSNFLLLFFAVFPLHQKEKATKKAYFLPIQLSIRSSCCISRPPFSGGFLGGGGGGPGGGPRGVAGGGRGTPSRRASSSARVGGSKGPTQRTYCSTPNRPRSARTCSARTRAQVSGWGGGEGGPPEQSDRF